MSVQKQDHPSIKVAIPGVSGVGKSTLFEKLIRRENAKWIFLYDHKDGDLARRFKVRPCFDVESLNAATEAGGVVIYNPGKEFPGAPAEGFEFFCRYVWAVKSVLKGKKIFGSDELDALVDERSKPDALCVILDQGRTFQIDCFFIAQAMNAVHNQVRKQFTEIFAMRQGDDNGIAWLDGKFPKGIDWENLPCGVFHYKNLLTGHYEKGGKPFIPKNASRDLRGL